MDERGKEGTEGNRQSSLISSYRDTNPIIRTPPLMTSLKSHDLPEAPCPNTITLVVGASTYEFEGAWNTHLQFIITCGNLWVVKF